ncbi:hypothetical protein [Paenibacillus sp. 481]|uniref:hypothetical protein n=1 Tax=Paenibacillus sp. 481 TaxID=2835869 RepID=UPI001E28F161|nr:hypothetical protein [Paenibacillus sp. 481]UHA74435.1 hypothetical protein KIK04_04830 [Paenibacillus sp. 481]
MDNLTYCVACGWGKGSASLLEIKQQEAKHGDYVCINCEEFFESIINAAKDEAIAINKGYGLPCEALITDNNIYYFDGPIIEDPKKDSLGFGGCWFLITKKYGEIRKVMVTNNLWRDRRVPAAYRIKLQQAGRIDSIVVGIERQELAKCKTLLNSIPYLQQEV